MHARILVPLFLAILAAGCAGAPRAPDSGGAVPPVGREAGAALVGVAAQLIGTPYRYGGASPQGFDCSGLVYYVHGRLGLQVPRTAAQQSRAARTVKLSALQPGDLVFFRVDSRSVDHVGIYAGRGRFIHAPRTGKVVSYAYLDDPYYRKRLVGAGRFWEAPGHARR